MPQKPHSSRPGAREITVRPVSRRVLWRRRLLKLGGWMMLMFLLTALLLAVGAVVLYQERIKLVNQVLDLPDSPFEIRVGDIDATLDGDFVARDLTLRLPDAEPGDMMLHIPEATWKVQWRSAVRGEIEELILREPLLAIDPENLQTLREWLGTGPPAPAGSPPDPLTSLNLAPSAERLQVDNGALDLQLPGLPRIRARVDFQGDAVGILAGQADRIRTGRQSLTLREVRIEAPEATPSRTPASRLLEVERVDLAFQIRDGILSVLDFQVHDAALEADPEAVGLLLATLEQWRGAPAASARPGRLASPGSVEDTRPPTWFRSVEWQDLALTGASIRLHPGELTLPGRESSPPLPLPGLSGTLDLELDGGGWSAATGLDAGEVRFSLVQAALTDPVTGFQGLLADQFSSGIRFPRPGSLAVSRTRLLHPQVLIGPELVGTLRAWLDLLSELREPDPDRAPGGWALASLEVVGGTLAITGLGPDLPDVRAAVDAELPGWRATASGPLSDDSQHVQLTDLELRFPDSDPFFVAEIIEFEGVPSAMLEERRIEGLSLREPVWNLTPERLPLLADMGGKAVPNESSDRPLWHGWWVRHLQLNHASFEAAGLPRGLPDASAGFSMFSVLSPESDLPVYYLTMEQAEARLPDVSDAPVAMLRRAAMRIRPDELWRDGNLGTLDLVGARLYAGAGLRDHFASQTDEETEAPADEPAVELPASDWATDWHLQELILRDSVLTISDIAPGLPDLPITLDLTTDMVPLTESGMRENRQLIKLELGTALRSPNDVRYVVADLRSMFVEFTLAGLLQQEIERVQVIAPTLNIGEHLFAYIESYRESTKAPKDTGVPDGPIPDADEFAAPGGWNIRRIEVESGQLVVAPKGVALFPNPFPFSAVTELADGRIDASFQVPRDDYEFDQLDLHLYGLSGEVLFHLPLAGEDNNLVEVLRADRIRWRDFEATDAYLSISYDRFGIYIGLGGNAYEGYVNGEFNIYVEHLFNWDGWLAFTGINVLGLTEIISPEYFLMKGTVDLKLIAQGNMEELFEAFGELNCPTPGTIHITQLDGLIDNLPPDWSSLKREITRLGVEPLRWFEYNEGTGSFELRRLGGTISLALEGDQGRRAFDVELHGQPLSMFIEPILPDSLPAGIPTLAPIEGGTTESATINE